MKKKFETVEQFLARGGTIQKVPEKTREKQIEVVKTTAKGEPATILTLEDAALFYGEPGKQPKKKKAKPSLKIDLNALPEALRKKFISKLKEEGNGESDFEEGDESEEESDDAQEDDGEEA